MLRNAGVIEVVIQSLINCENDVRFYIAQVLVNLTNRHAENKKMVIEAGGLPALMACLADKDSGMRRHAITVLVNLTSIADNNHPMLQPANLQLIMHCLTDENADVRLLAIEVFHNLAVPADNKKVIREAGVLPRLLVCLTDIDEKVRNLAAITMLYILHNSDRVKRKRASDTTVGAALAKELSSWSLSGGTMDQRNSPDIEAVAHIIVRSLRGKTEIVRRHATCVLKNLATNDSNKQVIQRVKGLPVLMACLADKQIDMRCDAIKALVNLAINADNNHPMLQPANLQLIMHCLTDENADVRRFAIAVFHNLAAHADNNHPMLQPANLQLIMHCLTDENADVHHLAIKVFRT